MSSPNVDGTPEISFLISNKGKRLLVINGFVYQQNKSTAKVNYWVCEEKLCNAGVHLTSNDLFLKYTQNAHTHLPKPERLVIRKMMTKVKTRVDRETTAIGQIYTEELVKANLSRTALAIAPTAREANHGLNVLRRRTTPVLPTSVDFNIPSRYQKTTDGERYLLADRIQPGGEKVEKRLIIFSTDEQLRLLFTSPHIMMDGTFDSCPPYFEQVFSIHGIKNKQSFVCVFAVLCGRSTVIYKELISVLHQHARRLDLQFRPTNITTDFEPALIKTVADEFPNAHHIGCYFHYTKSVYRQIQQLGLVTVYHDDEDARSSARKLMALPLIPLNQIERGFREISNNAPDSIRQLIDYFNRYWMTKVKWALWNVSDVDVRTNNIVEGWNHRFNRLVAKYHPNVWHFFDCLRKEEVVVRQKILKMMTGAKKNINRKDIIFQQRVDSLASDFNQNKINLGDYLQGLSVLIGAK
ncbi:unnamed protein product [Rotaria sordida]|uniref:MULE transposase domain-containing protein n=1 Tax=Rotaria sordida TaxID=392033 RepID=A0A814ZIB2_9BILA|nr:unnamed protein product [Rotaria sordida]CAF1245761.1 unnamed protein product [Rotaria sordida]